MNKVLKFQQQITVTVTVGIIFLVITLLACILQSLFSGSNPLITYCTSEEVISQAEAVVLSYMNESYSHDLMSTDAEVTNPITCPSALAGYSRNLRRVKWWIIKAVHVHAIVS